MPARNTAQTYGTVTRTFHWLTALLILSVVPLGLIANDSRGHTIRISPPLNISDDEIDYLCDNLEKVLVKPRAV